MLYYVGASLFLVEFDFHVIRSNLSFFQFFRTDNVFLSPFPRYLCLDLILSTFVGCFDLSPILDTRKYKRHKSHMTPNGLHFDDDVY